MMIVAPGWRRIRQAVQILTFVLFVVLLFSTRQGQSGLLPHDLFFRLDPLAGVSAMLAERRWIGRLALGGITLATALLVGRSWCGWLCPLGSLLDWTTPRRPHRDRAPLSARWRQVKHGVWMAVLVAALLGSLTLLMFDPLTLLLRATATAIAPSLTRLVGWLELVLYRFRVLQGPLSTFDHAVRGWLLTPPRPTYQGGLIAAALLAAVLALNAIRPRFWCRYLCPLGGLLGLFSKLSLVRHVLDSEACTECGLCAQICPTEAIDRNQQFRADPAECVVCLDCRESCPTDAISWGLITGPSERQSYDPSRRQALAAAATAVAGVGLLRLAPWATRQHPRLIQPPGALDNDLLSKCIRCGQCLKVCPTSGLQPSLIEAGPEGLWTPVLIPRLGYCDYSCNSCGQVCPTGAIPSLGLDEKRQSVIGLAYIDENRCTPWADGFDCIVCEEMCPVPDKAIRLEEHTVTNCSGEEVVVRRPRVIRDRCIGCGICEYKCPLIGEAAIRIYVPNTLAAGTS